MSKTNELILYEQPLLSSEEPYYSIEETLIAMQAAREDERQQIAEIVKIWLAQYRWDNTQPYMNLLKEIQK